MLISVCACSLLKEVNDIASSSYFHGESHQKRDFPV